MTETETEIRKSFLCILHAATEEVGLFLFFLVAPLLYTYSKFTLKDIEYIGIIDYNMYKDIILD